MREIKIPVFPIVQNKISMLVFTVPTKIIYERFDVSRRVSDKKLGYQRSFSKTRIKQIENYINNEQGVIPNSILVNLDPDKYNYSEDDKINYQISPEAFYELNLDIKEFNKILKDNHNSPFEQTKENSKIDNYARRNLRLSMARLRMLTYILNIIAVRNLEYQSYYQRNMRNRLNAIKQRYPNLSQWINEFFQNWLIFNPEIIEDDLI